MSQESQPSSNEDIPDIDINNLIITEDDLLKDYILNSDLNYLGDNSLNSENSCNDDSSSDFDTDPLEYSVDPLDPAYDSEEEINTLTKKQKKKQARREARIKKKQQNNLVKDGVAIEKKLKKKKPRDLMALLTINHDAIHSFVVQQEINHTLLAPM